MKVVLVPVILAALAASAGISAQNPPQTAPPAQAQPTQAPPLGPNEWRIDGNHSAGHFGVRHLMVSTVRGQLGRITGTIEYDGKDVSSIKADVAIDLEAITTQNSRDNHLRSDDFFDVGNHPTLTFKSKRVEPAGDGRFKLTGDLTIRGNTKEVRSTWKVPRPW